MLFSAKVHFKEFFVSKILLFCNKTVQDKLNHVIFCKYYAAVAYDVYFIMITYLKTVSCI